MAITGGDKKEMQAEGVKEKIMEKEMNDAPKGVPPALMASADEDKVGKEQLKEFTEVVEAKEKASDVKVSK